MMMVMVMVVVVIVVVAALGALKLGALTLLNADSLNIEKRW